MMHSSSKMLALKASPIKNTPHSKKGPKKNGLPLWLKIREKSHFTICDSVNAKNNYEVNVLSMYKLKSVNLPKYNLLVIFNHCGLNSEHYTVLKVSK